MTITNIDYCILGLTRKQSLSGYAIRRVFETTALGNFSSSPGTIYPALTRLVKHKLVTKGAGNASHNSYNATPAGIKALDEWIFQPITITVISKNPSEVLLRFAFMDEATSKKRKRKFLEDYKSHLLKYVQELQNYYSKESEGMLLHGRLAFEHGIQSYKASLKWANDTITKI